MVVSMVTIFNVVVVTISWHVVIHVVIHVVFAGGHFWFASIVRVNWSGIFCDKSRVAPAKVKPTHVDTM